MIGRLLRIFFLLRHSGIDCEPFVQPPTKAHYSGNRQNQRVGIAGRGGGYAVLVSDDAVFLSIFPILIEIKYKRPSENLNPAFSDGLLIFKLKTILPESCKPESD